MGIINKLKPKHYEFKSDVQYTSLHLPHGKHYGLLAQDIEQVLPDLVHEENFHIPVSAEAEVIQPKTSDRRDINQHRPAMPPKTDNISVKAVNYIELIPIMIKAMQEQNQVIQQQHEKIEMLTQKLNGLTASANNSAVNVQLANAYLGQSIPNPAKNTTAISYNNLPSNVNAKLLVFNAQGKMIRQINLNKGKDGSVKLDVSLLSAGTYTYSLLLNERLVETKTMEIVR